MVVTLHSIEKALTLVVKMFYLRVKNLKEGDFIRIDYVGRVSESGEIFDLTREDIAKEKKIYNPRFKYNPVPIIIGANLLVKGLEDELKKMKVGERKKVKINPEKGFGKRNPELIRLIPLSKFKKEKPYPGMIINVSNITGRVLSVSGGRVRVDFNHPLAGKTLEYDIEIKEKITEPKEKVKAIIEFFLKSTEGIEVKINEERVEIKINKEKDAPRKIRIAIAEMIKKWLRKKKVLFIEEY